MDDRGRPRVLLLSAGNTNDITMAQALIEAAGPFQRLLADRGCDADHLRKRLAERQAEAIIHTTTAHTLRHGRLSQRNTVERLWARLKDYRRVATHDDKLADNVLARVLIAAIVSYWAK